jgi:uncharacterized membrane protein
MSGCSAKTFPFDLGLTVPSTCLLFRGMADKHYRSLVKAVSWRITGSIDTMIITFLITGKLRWALTVSGVELFTKIGLYYVHERIWEKISIGRMQEAKDKPNFEI